MGSIQAGRVYRVRQLPLHLGDTSRTAVYLASIAPVLGAADNIRVFSLAQENQTSKTATVTFKNLPSIFDNDGQQWTLQAENFSECNIIVDTHFRGFTVLNDLRHSSRTADCVAISGLASHPFGSWKYREPGSDFMWLRDRLPKDVPQLRSLIYGYDTKLFKSRSFQDLDDIAWSFIASLKEIRRSLPPPKPLFFLAHSLGGIVLKRALVLLAHHGKDEEKKILESVKGVVFFGVPHRGMKISHLLAMVAKQPNEDLVNMTLSPESALLPELDKEFSKIAVGVKQNIRFVYETVQSQLTERNPAGTWVRSETSYDTLVNKDSAVPPGTPPLHTIAVNEDHSNMVKFGEDDPVYHVIKSFLINVSKDTHGQRSSHSTPAYSPASQSSPLDTHDPSKGGIVDSTLLVPIQKRKRTVSTVPFSRDPSFVGREDILAQLEAEFADLKSQNWASLFGLGGIGKSQIAIEHSYRQKKRSPQTSTFWIHASSKVRFEQSYTELATKVELPGIGDGKFDTLVSVSKWLADEENGPWLLILDNADDANLLLNPPKSDAAQRCLIDFIPRVQHGVVLITTRDRTCALRLTGYRGTPVQVLSMNLDESVELLRIWLPEAVQAEASELVDELEKMPLSISQASAYIKEVPRVTIPKYLAIFRRSNEDKVALLNKNKEDLRRDGEVPNAVITSWELSFNQLRETSPGSADLLSLMSYFNRQAIPQCLVQRDDDEVSFEEDINPLISFSLIRAEIREDTFEMHRLVQVATQHWLCSEGYDQLWKERAVERVAHRFPITNQRQYWPLCEALMSHADEVIPYIGGSKESELKRADLLDNTAWYLITRHGHAELALRRSTDALQIRRKYFDDDSAEILQSLATSAAAQSELLKYEEAKGLKEIVLKQTLKIWGPEHQRSLAAMHNLASSHRLLGNYEKAKELLERAVEVREKTLAQEDPDLLGSRNALASIYIDLGKFEEAEKVSVEILEVYTRRHGLQHPEALYAMRNLSQAYLQQNKVEETENLIAKFIPLSTKLFGPTHWRTLDARRTLAEIYRRQGKPDEAKGICRSCLEIAQNLYGPQHETTLGIKHVLGLIYRNQGEFNDALRLLKDTADNSTERLGSDHPNTLSYMQSLAICYHVMGDKYHAIHLLAEVLEKQKRVLPANHPDTTRSAKWLASWKSEVEESVERETKEEESEVEEDDEDDIVRE